MIKITKSSSGGTPNGQFTEIPNRASLRHGVSVQFAALSF
jgi:hypothetical protein